MPAPNPDILQLQDRDLSILRGLFESPVMMAVHFATVFFDGKPEAAKERMQKLKASGFIAVRLGCVNATYV